MTTTEEEVTALVTEARGGFNLLDRLQGRSIREDTVTVFTDEVLGEKHAALEKKMALISTQAVGLKKLSDAALLVGLVEESEWLQTRADERTVDMDEYNKVDAEAVAVAKEIHESALTIKMRALPKVVKKDAHRRARKALNITSKGIPDAQADDYNERYLAELLALSLVTIYDHQSKKTVSEIGIGDALDLQGFLPEWEWLKINNALIDLQAKNAISESVTDDANF